MFGFGWREIKSIETRVSGGMPNDIILWVCARVFANEWWRAKGMLRVAHRRPLVAMIDDYSVPFILINDNINFGGAREHIDNITDR